MYIELYEYKNKFCYRQKANVTLTAQDAIISYTYRKYKNVKYLEWHLDFLLDDVGLGKYWYLNRFQYDTHDYALNVCKAEAAVIKLLSFIKNKESFVALYAKENTICSTNMIVTEPFIGFHTIYTKSGDPAQVIRVRFATNYYNKGRRNTPRVVPRYRYRKCKTNPFLSPSISKECKNYEFDNIFYTRDFNFTFNK